MMDLIARHLQSPHWQVFYLKHSTTRGNNTCSLDLLLMAVLRETDSMQLIKVLQLQLRQHQLLPQLQVSVVHVHSTRIAQAYRFADCMSQRPIKPNFIVLKS
jgi:hypothetical protein